MIELSEEQEASLQALVDGKYFDSIEKGLAFLFRHLEAMRQEGSLLTIEERAELDRRAKKALAGEGREVNDLEAYFEGVRAKADSMRVAAGAVK